MLIQLTREFNCTREFMAGGRRLYCESLPDTMAQILLQSKTSSNTEPGQMQSTLKKKKSGDSNGI